MRSCESKPCDPVKAATLARFSSGIVPTAEYRQQVSSHGDVTDIVFPVLPLASMPAVHPFELMHVSALRWAILTGVSMLQPFCESDLNHMPPGNSVTPAVIKPLDHDD